MDFPVEIIQHTNPAISVTVAEAGGGGGDLLTPSAVTYAQIKQSLGTQVYNIKNLYMYSTNINQLLGTIQYQIFDASGNQIYSTIVTTISPYQDNAIAIDLDLTKFEAPLILNGNSSFSTTILPNTFVQVKFYADRITNEFGGNLDNFKQIEIDANKPYFFNNYGAEIDAIQQTNDEIKETASVGFEQKELPEQLKEIETIEAEYEVVSPIMVNQPPVDVQPTDTVQKPIVKEAQVDYVPILFLGLAAVSIGAYLMKKKN